jgi:glucose-6-phosphate 1-dehydrogenase
VSGHHPALFLVFGGTGDLAARKLFPALGRSAVENHLHPRTQVVGLGRSPKSDHEFRQDVHRAMEAAGFSRDDAELLVDRIHYQPMGDYKPDDFQALAGRLEGICRASDIPQNYAFYLSLPPRAMPAAVHGLGEAGLNRPKGWSRIVLEKPFGRDLGSAEHLNGLVHEHFGEEQVYRIDHYLGKETVQNLLVFRLANAMIESAWNRDRVDSVQISVGETLGVGSRAGYYDQSGALRDMVQNHLTQLLSLVAMEPPASFDAEAIRYEKIKVLRSIKPLDLGRVVRGQYVGGTVESESVRGYLEEQDVPAGSQTETFLALELFVDSWRWQGVPFYLRTGKRLPRKTTQIAIRFRESPVSFFENLGCSSDTADVLIITLQPNEGFSFHFDIKRPGEPFCLDQIPLRFSYGDRFDGVPDAYQTLLVDVIEGDQTLFVHADEVEQSWRVFKPLLANPPGVRPYPAGTWGPPEADSLAIPETALWQSE